MSPKNKMITTGISLITIGGASFVWGSVILGRNFWPKQPKAGWTKTDSTWKFHDNTSDSVVTLAMKGPPPPTKRAKKFQVYRHEGARYEVRTMDNKYVGDITTTKSDEEFMAWFNEHFEDNDKVTADSLALTLEDFNLMRVSDAEYCKEHAEDIAKWEKSTGQKRKGFNP